jgi:HPt (histidine-containing phosphotransfer) domain-containing protein
MAAAAPNPTVTSRQPVLLTLVLLAEVAVFMICLFWIAFINSNEYAHSTLSVTQAKLAARQSALAERLSADLSQLEIVPADDTRNADAATDLSRTFDTLANTENAFEVGAKTTDLSGKEIAVPALTSPAEQQTLNEIDHQLGDIRLTIGAFSDPTHLPKDVATRARDAAARLNGLADQTNNLAAQVATEGSATQSGGLRDWLFRIAIVMVLAMVATLFERVSRGRAQIQAYAEDLAQKREEAEAATRQLATAKASGDLIMETVDRGLFLIRSDFRIDGQYSRELEKIFRTAGLNGYNFLNVLQNLLTERTFDISRDYLGLLFDIKKKERTVLRVNPLAEVEVHFANPAGGFDSKFLNFSFRRIVENDVVSRVFVAVSDITERVRLERELRESEAKKERQFEFLLGVLHVEARALDDFLATAREQVAIMNDALRASDFATTGNTRMDLLRQRLDTVYRAVHTIKGNAAMLTLTYFQKICDQFEGKIVSLRDRRALSGDDFLSVVIAQSELRQDIEELQDLRERFVGSGRTAIAKEMLAHAPQNSNGSAADLVAGLTTLATTIADRTGKHVQIDARRFSEDGLSEEMRRAIKDVLIQLTRNSVAHGIESPQEREMSGKPATATLEVATQRTANTLSLTFRDDGRGLDPTFIREKAVERKLISPKTAAAMNDQQVVALIFRSGFSTSDDATTDSGRGVGMNVIKDIVVDRFGGRLTLNSDPGKFTEFGFEFPLEPKSSNPQIPELSYS